MHHPPHAALRLAGGGGRGKSLHAEAEMGLNLIQLISPTGNEIENKLYAYMILLLTSSAAIH
jgi:hypothetical protein